MKNPLIYSSLDIQVPMPIAFSGWKHHLGFMRSSIHSLGNSLDDMSIITICNGIGGSVTDVYYGLLTPECIASEVYKLLQRQKVDCLSTYALWLKDMERDFRLIDLSDGSTWVLRLGKFPQRFVHIHPARKSNFSIRIRSTILKSMLAYYLVKGFARESPTLTTLNEVRIKLLKLPPFKEGVLNHQIFTLVKCVNG